MNDLKVYFKQKTHQYFNEDDIEYISVSGLVKKLKPAKNWKIIAGKQAKVLTKAGSPITQKQLLEKWADKRDFSIRVGTLYHSIREKELIDSSGNSFYDTPCGVKQCDYIEGVKWGIPLRELKKNTVYPELVVYDHDYKISGQPDKVIVTSDTIHIWDYKTDENISFDAFSNDWVKPEKFLPPIHHLDNASGNEYCIKMSMYMYMLWKQNKHLKTGELVIEHINLKRDSEGYPVLFDNKPIVLSKELIKLPYRRSEVKDIFEFYKEGKLK